MSLKLIISNEILGISFEECDPTTVGIEIIQISTTNSFKDINKILERDHNALEEWDIIINDI